MAQTSQILLSSPFDYLVAMLPQLPVPDHSSHDTGLSLLPRRLYLLSIIAGLAIVNIVTVSLTVGKPYNFVLGESQGILHSILACRLVRHLRKVGSRKTVDLDHSKILYDATFTTQEHTTLDSIRFEEVLPDALTVSEIFAGPIHTTQASWDLQVPVQAQ
ncbi:hypothetical protein FA15DRAFT_710575 [Coprinopsis marcescibilis]|uniref:Uncharacterized protein n=1 Tax=Coprinopsis marcescibilis TaxID=230819 RepID=A0A5C3KD13_COPMA|nr:hypothetical protein FA15DRAFT_710575 [Coprinopsis marcescibilis]